MTRGKVAMDASGISSRSCMYRLLSSLFARELTGADIESIQSGGMAELMNALEAIDSCALLIRGLKNYFVDLTDVKKAALDFAESYAWLFHGVAGPDAVPLTASVYLGPDGKLCQQTEVDFFKLLGKYGLCPKSYAHEPCDHLSVILEFVSWLDDQALSNEDSEPWLAEQQTVIETYLLSWLPDFAARCKRSDSHGFYAWLAEETLEFVADDVRQF